MVLLERHCIVHLRPGVWVREAGAKDIGFNRLVWRITKRIEEDPDPEGVREALPHIGLGDASSFGFITVEKIRARPTGFNRCDLPGEIIDITDPGIESEAAGRWKAVPSVARQKDFAVTVAPRYLR